MIIECPACRTRFRLDDAKIRGRGVRARCRRCGETFVVMKPEAGPAAGAVESGPSPDLAAALREPAAPSRRQAGSPVGFPPPGGVETAPSSGERAVEPPPPAPTAEPQEPPQAPDEVDVAFDRLLAEPPPGALEEPSQEPVFPEPPPAERAPVEPGPVSDEAPPFAPEALSAAEPAGPADGAPPAVREKETTVSTESLFEDRTPDASAGVDHPAPDTAPEPATAPEPPFAPAPDEALGFPPEEPAAAPAEPPSPPMELVSDITDQIREAAEAAPAAPAEPPPYGLVGDDFLREEKREAYDITSSVQAQPAGAESEVPGDGGSAVERGRAQDFQDELSSLGAAAAPAAAGRGGTVPERAPAAQQHPAAVPERGPAAESAARRRPAVWLLIALFAVLAAGGAWLGFTEDGQRALRGLLTRGESWIPGTRKPVPAYAVSNVIGYYEPAARAGRLFVIKGQVTNVSHARKPGIRIVATLLDAKGREIGRTEVNAGTALSGDFLRSAARENIAAEIANPVGKTLQNLDIPPGRTTPFTAVFFDAPDGIDAYRVEAKDGA